MRLFYKSCSLYNVQVGLPVPHIYRDHYRLSLSIEQRPFRLPTPAQCDMRLHTMFCRLELSEDAGTSMNRAERASLLRRKK